jgi:hypothetical protein
VGTEGGKPGAGAGAFGRSTNGNFGNCGVEGNKDRTGLENPGAVGSDTELIQAGDVGALRALMPPTPVSTDTPANGDDAGATVAAESDSELADPGAGFQCPGNQERTSERSLGAVTSSNRSTL